MADLISTLDMLSVFIGRSSPGCSTGWFKGGGQLSTSSKCSSRVQVVRQLWQGCHLPHCDQLTLIRSSSAKNSGCLIQPVKISLTCSFFSICGHLVDIAPLVTSTSCLYLLSDSILFHSIPFHSIPHFTPSSGPINFCFQLPSFFNLPPSIVREPFLSVPLHFPQHIFTCFDVHGLNSIPVLIHVSFFFFSSYARFQ